MKTNSTRISIDIPKAMHKKLKDTATFLGKSMREIIIESIEGYIVKSKSLNKKILKLIEETEKGIGLIKCKDTNDLFKKLGI